MNAKVAAGFFAGMVLAAGFYLLLRPMAPTPGNVITQGIIPFVSSESDVAVGPQVNLSIAAAATNCASRIISTASTSLVLAFKSSYSPVSNNRGVWQAASTTVAYDNAVYGCGAITGFASASSTVNVITTAQ